MAGPTEFIEQEKGVCGRIEGGRSAEFGLLQEFLKHPFQSGGYFENRWQFRVLRLLNQRLNIDIKVAQEFTKIIWLGRLFQGL